MHLSIKHLVTNFTAFICCCFHFFFLCKEDLESGKSLRYSDGQESQKSNTHRSGLDYDPEGRVMASKGAEQGKNKDFMKSTLAVLSHNTAVSPDTAMGRDQNEQKEAQLAGTSSSPSYKGPKYSKIVKNSRNLFNFSTDPESLRYDTCAKQYDIKLFNRFFFKCVIPEHFCF